MPIAHIDKRFVDTIEIPEAGAAFHWDDTIKGFGLKVSHRGRKTFILQYRAAKPKDSQTAIRNTPTKRFKIGRYPATTAAAARSEADRLTRAIRPEPGRRAADPQADRIEGKRSTFKAARIAFIAEKRKAGMRSADEIERLFDRLVAPKWDARPLAEITRGDAKALIASITAPVLANRLTAHLKSLFYWAAHDDERIEKSPMVMFRLPNVERPRDRTLTLAEIAEIWHAAETLIPRYAAALKLIILTGQRVGAVGRMRWPEIDKAEAVWKIPPEPGTKLKDTPHFVSLSPQALAVLDAIPRTTSSYVLGKSWDWDRDGKKPVDRAILEARRKIDPQAEPMPHWVVQDFRRSFETGLTKLGFDPLFVHRLTGHRTYGRGKVLDTYNQFWQERPERQRAWNAWGAAVMEAVSTAPPG